jgi:AcrR family transcriptional regulator
MGVIERKEREKIQRRNVIIDAAERIFFKEGIENASMDQVAGEEELYKAIVIRGFIALKRRLKEAAIASENGLENVKAISRAYISFSKEHSGYFNAILYYQNDQFDRRNMDSPHAVESLEGGNAVISVLINALKKGMEDGSISQTVNPVEVAFVLWSQITGLLQVIQRKMRIISYFYKIKETDMLDNYFLLLEKSLKT